MSSKKLKWWLCGIFLSLAALHVAAVLIDREVDTGWLRTFGSWFDLDKEYVVPALYNGLLLALCGIACASLALRQGPVKHKVVWWLLSAALVYLAIDESFVLHEQLAEPLRGLLSIGPGSLLYHAWVVPALAVTGLGILVTVYAVKHHLVTKSQTTIISLLALLVVLVVAIESIGTKVYSSPLGYRLGAVMIEELLEIGMVSYVLYRLLGISRSNLR